MPKLVRFFTKKFLPLLLALLPVLPPVRGETAAEDKEGSKMPPGFEVSFEIPAGDKDAFGNAIRKGTDAKTGWPLEIRHKGTGMHLVLIPAGSFDMGSNDGASDEKPVHKVTLTKPFYLGKYEITQGEWKKVMSDEPSLGAFTICTEMFGSGARMFGMIIIKERRETAQPG